MRRTLALSLLLGLAATAVQAQQPVSLRYSDTPNRSTRYRTEVDAWVRSPLLATGDTALPTVHIDLYGIRTIGEADAPGRIVFTELTDSSRYDMPAIRAVQPSMALSGDLMRGMRTITMMDAHGRGLVTRVLDTPNMPPDLPVLVKAIQSLAVTTIRLAMFSLPEQPAEPGDTWSDSLRYDQAGAEGLAQSMLSAGGVGLATYRLERVEARGGARIAVISTTARINAGAQEPGQSATLLVTLAGQVDFDIDAGSVVRSQIDLSGPMATRIGLIPVRVRATTQAL